MTLNTKKLATPNNIKLLSSFVDKNKAKEIFALLNKTPDEMIKHFIKDKDFNKARDLVKEFFPNPKKAYENREKYYTLMYEQICVILKKIGSVDAEEMDGCLAESMFCELHLLFDDVQDKGLFLGRLHRFCIELLESNSICVDQVVLSMIEYFGSRIEIGGDSRRPEFSLNIPSKLMKWKIENIEETGEVEKYFKDIVNLAQSNLESGSLGDSERLTISYDEDKNDVVIKANKDIPYHLAEGQDLLRKSGGHSEKKDN